VRAKPYDHAVGEEDALLRELAATAEVLLARHVAMAREWFPHRLTADVAEQVPAPEGVASALVVGILTEDNLPFYLAALVRQFGAGPPWFDWARRWAAEEMRHGTVLRDYVTRAGLVDLVALERARMAHVSATTLPQAPSVLEAIVYLALQERATYVAHRNTGRCLADVPGRRILERVALDENLHHLFYRDLVRAALTVDPSAAVVAIDAQVRHFSLPGTAIPGFAEHAGAIARNGIYSARILLDDVFVPVVVRHWGLGDLTRLRPDAVSARTRLLDFLERLDRIADRLTPVRPSSPGGAAGQGGRW
jgi:acyl-[acyl-carrier-protein] desaturase